MSLFHLDTVFKCHRCATVRENLNRDTAHVCGCRNSGPMWREVRRSRANWTLIVAVLLFGATAYAVVDEVLFWEHRHDKVGRSQDGS